MKIALGVVVCLFFLSSVYSQEYSYTHYDISDGLAGSTVYCITQDKDGFIWVGTETGVSRFDGTHFRTYTVADGLPDVEILEMYCDSRGRVWMASFRRSVCYYYKGKIYNQQNDSVLSRLRFSEGIDRFAEDSAGDILMMEKTRLHVLYPNGSIQEIDSINGRPVGSFGAVARAANGQFLVEADSGIFRISNKSMTRVSPVRIQNSWCNYIAMNAAGMIWRLDSSHVAIRSLGMDKAVIMPFERQHYQHNSFDLLDDSLFYFNEFLGVREYNLHTGAIRQFLPGRQVSHTFRDAAGNIWFTTLDQGIFRLNSDEFRTIPLQELNGRLSNVSCIAALGNHLFVGGDNNCYFVFGLPYPDHYRMKSLTMSSKNLIVGFGQMPDSHSYIATGQRIMEYNHGKELAHLAPVGLKSVFRINKDTLLLAAHWGAALMDLRTFRITDTVWRDRVTTVYYRKDTAFIGTLTGLFAIAADRSVTFMGKNIPFLQKRISALTESANGTLWIASYDAGVIGYRNGRLIANINKASGLTSDICRTMLVQNNNLWIGTDKGLNKIDLDKPDHPVIRYTHNDGLGSDMINCVYADSSVIYVGTPAGLSYFNDAKVNETE
ncbi:MAG TPA: two-component regulator propeller domain-containing protein, partial [Puia sp.]|nr:two-component regulator propeller domain-containing protein [Puia sp.]